MNDERLLNIETSTSFLERHIEEINRALLSQDRRIFELEKGIRRLQADLRAANENPDSFEED